VRDLRSVFLRKHEEVQKPTSAMYSNMMVQFSTVEHN